MEIRANTLQTTINSSYSSVVRPHSQEVSDNSSKKEKTGSIVEINKKLNELAKTDAKDSTNESLDSNNMDKKQLEEVIKELQAEIEFLKTKLNFKVDSNYNNSWLAQVINKDNNEVLRQFPPEYLLKISKSVKEMIKGILVDETT